MLWVHIRSASPSNIHLDKDHDTIIDKIVDSNNVQQTQLFTVKKILIFFLFLHKNVFCGYSLEVPPQVTYI